MIGQSQIAQIWNLPEADSQLLNRYLPSNSMRLKRQWRVSLSTSTANSSRLVYFLVLYEMSQILNCGLDQRTLTILAGLIENGVNPEALAAVVKELKRETEALKVNKKFYPPQMYSRLFRQLQDSYERFLRLS